MRELIDELDGLLVIFEKEVFVEIVLALMRGDVERTGGDGESHLLALYITFEVGEEPVASKLFDEKLVEFVAKLV